MFVNIADNVIVNSILVPQLFQETRDDIAAVCTSNTVSVAVVLVPLYLDVYEVDYVFSIFRR